ncbi:hypothetical protein GJ744_003118 [Endocarpon pusillum]|uniref:Uncharacterized protein n=1 Tax=Endocarpon pusillum TaxID=364733 RepID=A0A8H7E824_9EURO|nr:hypothetical protein GJ744_003118 [Endocarpon pusillum]
MQGLPSQHWESPLHPLLLVFVNAWSRTISSPPYYQPHRAQTERSKTLSSDHGQKDALLVFQKREVLMHRRYIRAVDDHQQKEYENCEQTDRGLETAS